jgi:hypothetical protein
MHHIAGSMEIAATCDYGIALIQNEGEHKDWVMRHKLLLNRNEEANIVVDCKIDYRTYSIWNTGVRPDTEDSDSGGDGKERRFQKRGDRGGGAPAGPVTPVAGAKPLDPGKMSKLKDMLAGKK